MVWRMRQTYDTPEAAPAAAPAPFQGATLEQRHDEDEQSESTIAPPNGAEGTEGETSKKERTDKPMRQKHGKKKRSRGNKDPIPADF